jgi:hypothetical protein
MLQHFFILFFLFFTHFNFADNPVLGYNTVGLLNETATQVQDTLISSINGPASVVIKSDGTKAYISNLLNGTVLPVSITGSSPSYTFTPEPTISASNAFNLLFISNESHLVITSISENVKVYNLATNAVQELNKGQYVSCDETKKKLYIANRFVTPNQVYVYSYADIASVTLEKTFTLDTTKISQARSITSDESYIYIGGGYNLSAALALINLNNSQITYPFIDPSIYGIAIRGLCKSKTDSNKLYIACGYLLIYDISLGTIGRVGKILPLSTDEPYYISSANSVFNNSADKLVVTGMATDESRECSAKNKLYVGDAVYQCGAWAGTSVYFLNGSDEVEESGLYPYFTGPQAMAEIGTSQDYLVLDCSPGISRPCSVGSSGVVKGLYRNINGPYYNLRGPFTK